MHRYWARHTGKVRWGARTPLPNADNAYISESEDIYGADKVEVQDGSLLFWKMES